jgi:hypothetical protein
MIEGLEAFNRLKNAMKAVLSVPHSEIKRRIEEQRKRSALNPNKREPKRKIKPSTSPDRASQQVGVSGSPFLPINCS